MRRLYIALVVLVATLAFAAAATARPAPKRAAHDRAGTTQPDQVIQWNRTLLQLLQTPGAQPATVHPTRTMAITQLAVYDAVVAIEGGTRSYLPQRPVLRPSSPAAAAAGAAHRALLSLFPGQRAVIDAKFQASLAQLGSSDRVRAGVRVGERAARAVLTARARDHSGAPASPFTPAPGPGEYQLTPPAFGQPVFTNWAAVTPFVLKRASE